LTGKTAEKSGVTAESLMKEAEEARVAAMASGQHSAAVSAIREKGVLSGQRIERRVADFFLQAPQYSFVNDNPLEYGDLFAFALLAATAIKFIRELVRPRPKTP
jgi:hypothetical protein